MTDLRASTDALGECSRSAFSARFKELVGEAPLARHRRTRSPDVGPECVDLPAVEGGRRRHLPGDATVSETSGCDMPLQSLYFRLPLTIMSGVGNAAGLLSA